VAGEKLLEALDGDVPSVDVQDHLDRMRLAVNLKADHVV
jgi:hypothetical protein